MNHSQYPYEQPNRPDPMPNGRRPADPGYGYPSDRNAADNSRRNAYNGRRMLRGAAGHAEPSAERVTENADRLEWKRHRTDRDGRADIADEVTATRLTHRHSDPYAEYSSEADEVSARVRTPQDAAKHYGAAPKAAAEQRSRRNPEAHTVRPEDEGSEAVLSQPDQFTKKRRTFKDFLKTFLPWKGDSAFEIMRKIVFSMALVVVGVCAFLISSYYIDRYKGKKEYEEWNKLYEETLKNRSFEDNEYEGPEKGSASEYLELNELARWLEINPDFVGYINIPGTVVSYPVVQKKSDDINNNVNNYYLYRTFKGEENRAGCIFMDYRCHFDEVVDHRRIVENSGNVFIYGHDMGNRTMFGSLRDYVNLGPNFYSEHPIVEFSTPYNHYKFKIFAVFIVDGDDLYSSNAFDCWNTLDFEDEKAFYDYVNEAKKRTLICNDVDVEYGDQLLSLYTCNGLLKNAKLILMCRELRAGEDLYDGTKNATLNDNVLYPTAYYKAGYPDNYDPKKFVPYGPKS